MATTSRIGRVPASGIKLAVVVAAPGDIALTGEQTINAVAVTEGDRVLAPLQTDSTENGVYVVSTSTWSRASDWNEQADVLNGMLVLDANDGTLYSASFTGDYTPGTTPVTFSVVVGTLTGASIKSLYEAEANAFTDAQFTKLATIESGATADQTGAEIKTALFALGDTNNYDDAAVTALAANVAKLATIESGATADQTGAEIKTALFAEADTNNLTDALYAKLNSSDADLLNSQPPSFYLDRSNHTGTDANPPTIRVFTTTGGGITWTRPSSCVGVKVTCIGGGGEGGASGSVDDGGLGGSGGMVVEYLDVTGAGFDSPTTVTVGAGGSGGTPTGATGGTSSFGSYNQATGGAGGTGGDASGLTGADGVGSNGDLNLTGNNLPGYGVGGAGGAGGAAESGVDGTNGIVIVEEFY